MIAATVLEPESQVRRISDALHQQAVSDPVAAEVLPLIPTILITRFRDKTIPEICAMGGITLDDFTRAGPTRTSLAAVKPAAKPGKPPR